MAPFQPLCFKHLEDHPISMRTRIQQRKKSSHCSLKKMFTTPHDFSWRCWSKISRPTACFSGLGPLISDVIVANHQPRQTPVHLQHLRKRGPAGVRQLVGIQVQKQERSVDLQSLEDGLTWKQLGNSWGKKATVQVNRKRRIV